MNRSIGHQTFTKKADVVPSRRVIPTKPPRNFEDELRSELGDIVQLVAAEYVRLFPASAGGADPDAPNAEEPVTAEIKTFSSFKSR